MAFSIVHRPSSIVHRRFCLFHIVPASDSPYITFMNSKLTIAVLLILLCASGTRAQPFNQWVQGTLPAGPHSVLDLKINPLRPDTLYAATLPGTVFRSANRGATWTEVSTGLPGQIRALAITPTNPAILYAGTDNGVYRTANQGTTWSLNGLTGENVNRLLVMPDSATHVFAGTPGGLRRTRNSGTLWDSLTVDSLTTVAVRAIAVNPLRRDTLYVGTTAHGMYRSRNRGQTWTQINAGLNNLNISALVVHPTQPDTLYAATSGGIFRSTSGGAAWEPVNNGLTNLDIATLAIAPNRPAILYAGTQNGLVFRSSDHAASWFDITTNLPAGFRVGGLVVHPDSASVVYAGLDHIYRNRQRGLAPRLLLQTGEEPTALGVADFNGDGQADAVVANAGAGTLSLFTNEEQGTFFFSQRVVAGGEPISLAIGDINRDGSMDIAVGNRATRVVSILSNNGSGAFPSRLDLFVGQVPGALALADIDGDGRLDILAATRAPGNAISLFLNAGINQFATQREFPTGRDPVALAVADINNNGLIDLITADREDGRISLLLNRGGGQFAAPVPIATGGEPVGLVARDFDLDGRIDLAVIARNTEELVLLRNLGANAFATRRYPLEFQPIAIHAADIDRDGYPDLAISSDGRAVQKLINDAHGGFRFPLQTFDQTTSARALHLSDMDADGRVDLLSIQTNTRSLFIRRNDLPRDIKPPAPPRGITAADVQADLGGRIRISWHMPKVDEDSSRVTAYRAFRALVREGPYALIGEIPSANPSSTTDSLTIFRTYLDSTATVNHTYFYYLISVGTNNALSAPSDTASAASRAQPFLEFDFSRNGTYHTGDTVQVVVSLIPLDYAISGVSLYLNYNPRALAVVDADLTQPNIQPVQPSSAVLQGNQILENRLHQLQPGAINYSFASLTASDTTRIPLGSIRLVALRDTLSHLAVIDSPLVNRRTAVIERGSGNIVLPYLGSGRYAINVRGIQLNGQVVLQGRSQSQSVLLRVDVRRPNGAPLPDSIAYNPPNDLDHNPANGIQLQSDATGRFSLVQVPVGRHAIFVKNFHTLRARVLGDSLTVAAPSPGSFRTYWRSSLGVVVNDTLRGGDANDDNRVNLADFGILAAHFGTSGITPDHPAWAADFNNDGTVNLADFGILASNFGEVGMGQNIVFKPAIGPEVFALEPRETGVYALVLTAPVSGFSAEFSASDPNFTVTPGADLSNRALWIARPMADNRILSSAHALGENAVLPAGTEIALIYAEHPALHNPLAIDLAGQLWRSGLSDIQHATGPQRPALYPAFPNPFNPSTAIRYDVSEPSDVILEIYNLTGQKIRTLIQESKSPGTYTATWDGTGSDGRMLASGVYIYRISIGGFRDANKIILLK